MYPPSILLNLSMKGQCISPPPFGDFRRINVIKRDYINGPTLSIQGCRIQGLHSILIARIKFSLFLKYLKSCTRHFIILVQGVSKNQIYLSIFYIFIDQTDIIAINKHIFCHKYWKLDQDYLIDTLYPYCQRKKNSDPFYFISSCFSFVGEII